MIQQLVANGDDDRMLPTSNTVDTNERFPDSRIAIHLDAGHGGARRFRSELPATGCDVSRVDRAATRRRPRARH